jgi:hypothetical protein
VFSSDPLPCCTHRRSVSAPYTESLSIKLGALLTPVAASNKRKEDGNAWCGVCARPSTLLSRVALCGRALALHVAFLGGGRAGVVLLGRAAAKSP